MSEPITLEELKAHLRITHDQQDDQLEALIATAREEVESETWRGLVDAARTFQLRAFPDRSNGDQKIYLPYPPLRGVTSITYRDGAGNEIELDEDDYVVDALHEPGTIEPAPGTTWPATEDHPAAVVIECDTGYDDAEDVPAWAKHAIKLIAAELYNNDQPSPLAPPGGGTGVTRTTLDRLLDKRRLRHFGILETV